jgi:hypothetical protein
MFVTTITVSTRNRMTWSFHRATGYMDIGTSEVVENRASHWSAVRLLYHGVR